MAGDTATGTAFGPHSTADEVIRGIDLRGVRVIVTGGAAGLGYETSRVLAGAGAEVTVAVRDLASGTELARKTARAKPRGSIEARRLDLADPGSLEAFAGAWNGPVDVLINNAGVMALPERTLTPQGWELQFATNHLGHFALATLLHDSLAAAGDARILSLTSRGHFRSPVVFEDLHFASRAYEPFLAYGQSKTANVLFAVEATRRWAADGITANAVFPGVTPETRLVRHISEAVVNGKLKASGTAGKTLAQGAATPVFVASARVLDGVGGLYFEDCEAAAVVHDPDAQTAAGVAAYALDPDHARRLWEVSEQLVFG